MNKEITAYTASGIPGNPICVSGATGGDADLSVELYVRDGHLVGVLISDTVKIIGGAGVVPYELLAEK